MKKFIFKTAKNIKILSLIALVIGFSSYALLNNPRKAEALFGGPICCPCPTCRDALVECSRDVCACQSNAETTVTIRHITDEFIQQREWLIKVFWEAHLLPAMMFMTEQLTAVMTQQMMILGTLIDAKHQLESQRILQELQAQAHKDYQPSEGMCRFGTNTRALAASDRNATLTQIAISSHGTQRDLLSGDSISAGGQRDYTRSRLDQFKNKYCNAADFGNGMTRVCNSSGSTQINRDINYTNTVDQKQTLEIDFSLNNVTPDEEDILALSNNLYGNDVLPRIPEDKMALSNGTIIPKGAFPYMKMRSLVAHKNLTLSAYAAQVGRKSQGTDTVEPYIQAYLENMGLTTTDIAELIGPRPSYDAQMEFLTKTLYQTPNYYTELYDKPVNVERKIAAQSAIDLMQRRDTYRDSVITKAIISGYLDTILLKAEEAERSRREGMKSKNPLLSIPALN
ncbi:MAG TPA: hypothetical protein PLK85_04345 [Alphaproteobacteria bacterium]|nr:hypothetical protein [Alphaproteobacteria bacterium]